MVDNRIYRINYTYDISSQLQSAAYSQGQIVQYTFDSMRNLIMAEVASSCPKCGKGIQPGKKFCPKCGTSIGVPPVETLIVPDRHASPQQATLQEKPVLSSACSRCGAVLVPGKKFCPKCGAKIV